MAPRAEATPKEGYRSEPSCRLSPLFLKGRYGVHISVHHHLNPKQSLLATTQLLGFPDKPLGELSVLPHPSHLSPLMSASSLSTGDPASSGGRDVCTTRALTVPPLLPVSQQMPPKSPRYSRARRLGPLRTRPTSFVAPSLSCLAGVLSTPGHSALPSFCRGWALSAW